MLLPLRAESGRPSLGISIGVSAPSATSAASTTSGGASGDNDLHDAVYTAVVNKRAGGRGMISGRKAFQRPMAEGVELLNAIQDVYLDKSVTLA